MPTGSVAGQAQGLHLVAVNIDENQFRTYTVTAKRVSVQQQIPPIRRPVGLAMDKAFRLRERAGLTAVRVSHPDCITGFIGANAAP